MHLVGILYKSYVFLRISHPEVYSIHVFFNADLNFDQPVRVFSNISSIFIIFSFAVSKQSVVRPWKYPTSHQNFFALVSKNHAVLNESI